MSIVVLLLMIGATARLTHLVTTDLVSEPFRRWVENFELDHWGPEGLSLSTLLSCPWCIGFWISCAVGALTWWLGDYGWLQFIWAALSCSYVVGYVEEKL